ncbi:protein EARLY FLOWERING 4 [Morus notabilis]|uniref:protein EARLY FLOWERING 4 n=1 Tax=Morus notabilis TaxID=981085 RepID=UPI000CED15B8|nr:protein EARLY FLOWERING 4 [Morus notabilis]XP_024027928.1 protein EARLY FLOWERING 4 [Morus notabilis]
MEDRRNLTKRAAAAAGLENGGEEGDTELWKGFDQSFRQVQTVLDRNRSLIQQVNENHQSRIPDNMAKNVALIQELNGNISKVVSLYSDLNSNFSTLFNNHRSPSTNGG